MSQIPSRDGHRLNIYMVESLSYPNDLSRVLEVERGG